MEKQSAQHIPRDKNERIYDDQEIETTLGNESSRSENKRPRLYIPSKEWGEKAIRL